MTSLFEPTTLPCGAVLKNRFALAPLTNLQSNPDGTLGDAELRWLEMRAAAGFALTMTCATSVQESGRAFPGQLGAHTDSHVPGLARLAAAIKKHDTHAVVQLHHGGIRADVALTGQPLVAPSDDEKSGARAMSLSDVEQLAEDFIKAAIRCHKAGFDGIELHGAHGYLLCAFLSPDFNRREDRYGGSLENRSRLIFDILDGIRAACGEKFSLGVRLSPERFGMRIDEIRSLAQQLMTQARVDYIDMSLWDTFKEPEDDAFKGRTLGDWFAELDRGKARLGVAGKLTNGAACAKAMATGADFVFIGRGAVLHHDFPLQVAKDANFVAHALPVSVDHLRAEGLGDAFIEYMRSWPHFVAAD